MGFSPYIYYFSLASAFSFSAFTSAMKVFIFSILSLAILSSELIWTRASSWILASSSYCVTISYFLCLWRSSSRALTICKYSSSSCLFYSGPGCLAKNSFFPLGFVYFSINCDSVSFGINSFLLSLLRISLFWSYWVCWSRVTVFAYRD